MKRIICICVIGFILIGLAVFTAHKSNRVKETDLVFLKVSPVEQQEYLAQVYEGSIKNIGIVSSIEYTSYGVDLSAQLELVTFKTDKRSYSYIIDKSITLKQEVEKYISAQHPNQEIYVQEMSWFRPRVNDLICRLYISADRAKLAETTKGISDFVNNES